MPDSNAELQTTVKERFAHVALSPDQEKKFPVGPASAKKLGYDPHEIDALPISVTESFCGVGNPLGLGDLRAGGSSWNLGPHASGPEALDQGDDAGGHGSGADEVDQPQPVFA